MSSNLLTVPGQLRLTLSGMQVQIMYHPPFSRFKSRAERAQPLAIETSKGPD